MDAGRGHHSSPLPDFAREKKRERPRRIRDRLRACLKEPFRYGAVVNGAHEIRDWVIAHAAAGSSGFELIDYFPSPATLVGAGFASWRLSST